MCNKIREKKFLSKGAYFKHGRQNMADIDGQ